MQVIPVMPFVATYVLLLQTAAFSSKLVRLVYRTSHSLRITQKSGVVLAPTGDFVRRDLKISKRFVFGEYLLDAMTQRVSGYNQQALK